ncbi:MAG TPA: gluconate 2-dehydrogenase subunit 3 family protein [Candidatus Dormibacteraeota bacterium]|nr:gluconate 2-dehydrogenase subunit 3 family protein [Candidatus Dormibacteraeota bacterium]
MAYDRKQGGHQVAQANRPDYRLEVGRAEVPVGEARGFSILDPERAATLRAWVASLIPATGTNPDAAEVGAAEYIDATVLKVPALRPSLMQAIDRIERMAAAKAHRTFTKCTADERERLLREFEAEDATDAFSMVRDFTYEAYYGHPRVLAALESDSGWSRTSPTKGSPMAPFDASRLERVRSLPPRWRTAGAEIRKP